jgi:hypothetical protein
MRITTISSQEAITQVNGLLTSAAQIYSGNKATYQAKPKLKVWNADIKIALKEKRKSVGIDLDYRFLCYYLLLWNIMYEIIDF